MHICMYVCVYVCIYVCIDMYVCMYIRSQNFITYKIRSPASLAAASATCKTDLNMWSATPGMLHSAAEPPLMFMRRAAPAAVRRHGEKGSAEGMWNAAEYV